MGVLLGVENIFREKRFTLYHLRVGHTILYLLLFISLLFEKIAPQGEEINQIRLSDDEQGYQTVPPYLQKVVESLFY